MRQLHRCEFTEKAENIAPVGGPGTGKSHLAKALAVQAIEHHRKKAWFYSTVELVNALEQEKTNGKAGQLAERLVRCDLVSSMSWAISRSARPAAPCSFTC